MHMVVVGASMVREALLVVLVLVVVRVEALLLAWAPLAGMAAACGEVVRGWGRVAKAGVVARAEGSARPCMVRVGMVRAAGVVARAGPG